MKSRNEHSWFNIVKSVLERYNLPSPYKLLENAPSKEHER